MVQLIVGKKGKGKTKIILDMVNKRYLPYLVTSCILTKAMIICMN